MKGPRDLNGVLVTLFDELGEISADLKGDLLALEETVRYLPPEQQRDHWDALQKILEKHAPRGNALHSTAARIFNGEAT